MINLDPDTEERVVETVEDLSADLAFLARKQSLSQAEFTTDRTQNYAVKRGLQNAINAVIDIAEMVLIVAGVSNESMPATNREKSTGSPQRPESEMRSSQNSDDQQAFEIC